MNLCKSPPQTEVWYTAIIVRCPDTKLCTGYIPGFPGAHSQGETLEVLHANIHEVLQLLPEDGEPKLETEFVRTQAVMV
ncbi:MAG: type II toxin-antitoxin system HicB family antitoxin [Kiritimatiellae bacterium]|nr:type II toxin-antitoxin system HicB family antitoxin [Kiritimatiellia bacterium]